jgi:hypothetical protein
MEGTHLKGKVSFSCFSNFITMSHLLVPVPGMDSPLSLFPVRCCYGYSGDSTVLRLVLGKTPLTATCKYLLGTLCNMLLME